MLDDLNTICKLMYERYIFNRASINMNTMTDKKRLQVAFFLIFENSNLSKLIFITYYLEL